jgi:hypothetical protein
LDVLLGRAREGSAAGGHYMLPAGSDQGYLVDRDFRLFSGQALDWMEKRLLDVRPEDIERVVCEDPRSGRVLYTLARPEPGHEPVWTAAREQDRVQEHRIDAVFRALINLSMDDVAGPAGEASGPLTDVPGPRLLYHLYDGTTYAIYPGLPVPGKKDQFSLRIQVAYVPPDGMNLLPDDTYPADPAVLAGRAADQNARLAPWVYAVQAWRHGNFIVNPDGFAAPEH